MRSRRLNAGIPVLLAVVLVAGSVFAVSTKVSEKTIAIPLSEHIKKVENLQFELKDGYVKNGTVYLKTRDSSEIQPTAILVDTFIDIFPDKYSYNVNDYGTVNIHVKTYANPLGFASYFLKIPNGVTYINVYDGPQPSNVFYLDSGECQPIPNYGLVCGPATVLYWGVVHSWNYEKFIKVKVKYTSSGSFAMFSHVTEEQIPLGVKAQDSDSFSVTVN